MTRMLIVVATLVIVAGAAHGQTDVTEDISTNTTWDLAGSPYIIQANVEVVVSTLTIQAGVTVAFGGDYYLGTGAGGAIIATGASGNEILFTSNAPSPASSDWTWVQVRGTNPSSFSYCIFEYAQMGLRANTANPTISHCTFRGCGTGLSCVSASPTVEYCDIYGNREGVTIGGSSSNPTINYCNIYDNTNWNTYTSSYLEPPMVTIDAQHNWWGTDVEAGIANEIYDNVDNPDLYVTIDYDPWWMEQPVEAMTWGRVKALFAR